MASVWKRTMVYLGLVDDDEYDSYGYQDSARGGAAALPDAANASVRPVHRDESSAITPIPPPPGPSMAGSGTTTVVRTLTPGTPPTSRVHVIEPKGFNDAQEVGDRIKAGQPVILNIQGLDRGLQRRLVDFASGLTYALDGSMARAADQVFLLTPSNVEVSQEEKERLRGRGLYEDV
jgi:cell division inhibitor SepF